jgi:hypothetical protein
MTDRIQIIPHIDSDDPKIIEELTGNQKRAIIRCPKLIDFGSNMIYKAIKAGGLKNGIIEEYDNTFDKINVTVKTFNDYFKRCKNPQQRILLKRQITSNSTKCLIKGKDKKGKYIIFTSPVIFVSAKGYENDKTGKNNYFQFLFLKDIFRTIVENESKENFHYSYCKIPYAYYPSITNVYGARFLRGEQPLYRLIIFALSKKPRNRDKIFINQKELDTNILPEYLDKNSYLKGRYKREDLYKDLIALNLQLHDVLPDKKIIEALEYDKKNEKMIVHFNKEYSTYPLNKKK